MKQYYSPTRQARIKKYLQSLQSTNVKEERKINFSKGLEILKEMILKFGIQRPQNHGSKADLFKYM